MLNTARTLKTFFSGFDLPAYTLDSVPETVVLPYIVYPLIDPEWDSQAVTFFRVYYPKNRLADLLAKVDEVKAAIGYQRRFEQPGGYLVIYPTQDVNVGTDEYSQYAHVNILLNAYHEPGQ